LSLFALASSQAFAAYDVSGIQVGSPLAEQKAAITKINPSYRFSDMIYSTGKIVGVHAVAQKNGVPVDQFLAMQDDSGIVWLAARSQVLEKGERIKPDVFLNSLLEKYGPYTGLRGLSPFSKDEPMWQFDRQGNLYRGPVFQGPCWNIGTMQPIDGDFIVVPHTPNEKCGTVILVATLKDKIDGMILKFSVEIVDIKRMYDEVNAKASAAESKRQQQLDIEKSRNIKPKL